MPPASAFVWSAPDWPAWRFDAFAVAPALERLARAQGVVWGRLVGLGVVARDRFEVDALTSEVMATSAIEGEILPVASVRSSVARRLGVVSLAAEVVDRRAEGVVDMVWDAITNATAPLDTERLFAWHGLLFPTGRSGLLPIRVGAWRDDALGAMQVTSGPIGRPRVHFEAPPAERVAADMARFLAWVNAATPEPPLVKAALGHLWFVTVHPFDDGNGRIARAIGEMLLARADGAPARFFSASAQISRERPAYYAALEQAQRGTMDATAWVTWFLGMLERAVAHANDAVDAALRRAAAWQRWSGLPLNPRQAKVLNQLLDGFDGNLTTARWASMTKCSPDTALRDIQELIDMGVLRRSDAGGRSTRYTLV